MNTLSALNYNLKRLAILRLITCAGIAVALIYLETSLHHDPDLGVGWFIWGLLTVLSVVNLIRAKQKSAGQNELFAYLMLDSGLIVLLIYFTGGANNPFITYLLVPIVISAATQSWTKTWSLCVLAIAAYAFVLFYHVPLPMLHMHHSGMNLHIVGMLLTFIMSALFIAYFVVDMAQQLTNEQNQVAKLREQSIQNEHVMVVANQAAATAHELGTPLTTMAVVTQDLLTQEVSEEEKKEDLSLIQQQIQLCKEKLKLLVSHAQSNAKQEPLVDFIQTTLDQWLLMRPHAQYQWQKPKEISPEVQYPLVLQQAIINLLNNAMDASPEKIQIDLNWSKQNWCLEIQDQGSGIDQERTRQLNKPQPSDAGMGIGLLLTHSSVQRLGGHVEWQNLPSGGCVTKIEVPFG